jgi:succinate dehydrogenase / fumarate reductase, membrane anchor subunit
MSSAPLLPTPSPTKARIRTPLARVRGLGSAKDGTSHFWWIRVSSVLLVFLTVHAIALAISLVGADYGAAKAALARPINAIPLLLLIIASVYHMWLGMQVIIEDYLHSEGPKIVCLMLNWIFSAVVGLTCVFAVLKLSFGA